MTREEAMELLKAKRFEINTTVNGETAFSQALEIALNVLEQEPCCNCIEFKRYAKEMGFDIEQKPVLDKIRAEMERIPTMPYATAYTFKKEALKIIDKYKAESEDK